MKRISVIIATIACVAAPVYADGLGTLIQVGRNQAEIAKAFEEEQKTYNRVVRALEQGEIKPGDTKAAIREKYGDPVVEMPKEGTTPEKWIYKPAADSYFEGTKIYFFFDDAGKLIETKTVVLPKKEKK